MKRSKCQSCRNDVRLPFDFTMAFQPIIDMQVREVWGYEALVRGVNGEGAGHILELVDDANRYRFDQACRVKAIELAADLFKTPELKLSINFMPNAVYEPAACIRATLEAAERTGFSRSSLIFEFTENERINDVDHIRRIIFEYRRHQFHTALDDFGAGYAGLNLLACFQPDYIKLDMDLIRGVDHSPARQAIVSHVTALARDLSVHVLAEGVETNAELIALRACGIRLFQGYLFAKPSIGRLPQLVNSLGAPFSEYDGYGEDTAA